MLQLLAHFFRHTEFWKVRHGDRLLPVFCILYGLFQCWMHSTNEVPCQVRPGSPNRVDFLSELVWHQTLRIQEP